MKHQLIFYEKKKKNSLKVLSATIVPGTLKFDVQIFQILLFSENLCLMSGFYQICTYTDNR